MVTAAIAWETMEGTTVAAAAMIELDEISWGLRMGELEGGGNDWI